MVKKIPKRPSESQEQGGARVLITILADDYTDLKRTADKKRLLIAWIVRDAVHEYLRNREPLFWS